MAYGSSLLAAWLLVAGAGTALADDTVDAPPSTPFDASAQDADARRHFEAGRAHFEDARYVEAHAEFEEAYRLSGRPALLLNMSRAREADLKPAQAIVDLDRWLALGIDDPAEHEYVVNRRRRLEAQVARQEAERSEPQAAPAPAAGAPLASPPVEPVRPHRQRVGYALVGVGAALGVGGAAVWMVGHDDIRSVEHPAAGSSWDDVRADYEHGPRRVVIGIGLVSAAVAVAAVGVVLLMLPERHRPREALQRGMLGGRF